MSWDAPNGSCLIDERFANALMEQRISNGMRDAGWDWTFYGDEWGLHDSVQLNPTLFPSGADHFQQAKEKGFHSMLYTDGDAITSSGMMMGYLSQPEDYAKAMVAFGIDGIFDGQSTSDQDPVTCESSRLRFIVAAQNAAIRPVWMTASLTPEARRPWQAMAYDSVWYVEEDYAQLGDAPEIYGKWLQAARSSIPQWLGLRTGAHMGGMQRNWATWRSDSTWRIICPADRLVVLSRNSLPGGPQEAAFKQYYLPDLLNEKANAIHRDALRSPGVILNDDPLHWTVVRKLSDGAALAFFNHDTSHYQTMSVEFSQLEMPDNSPIWDVWENNYLAESRAAAITGLVPPMGVKLFKVTNTQK